MYVKMRRVYNRIPLRIGAVVKLKPNYQCDKLGHSLREKIPGKIVYINYAHRFFTAEFYFSGGGHFRESFKFIAKEDFPCRVN